MKSMHSVLQKDHKDEALNADDSPRDEATAAHQGGEAVQLDPEDMEAHQGKEDTVALLKGADMEALQVEEAQLAEEDGMSEAGQSKPLR